MSSSIVVLIDSRGQGAVIVPEKVTHIVLSDSEHSEVHFDSGSFVRVKGTVDEVTDLIWVDQAR